MKKKKSRLAFKEKHLERCHERWQERRNRKQDDLDYKEEWYSEQCGSCQYFISLTGKFSEDYGVCSNSDSEFDGFVRFEHDGCEKYSEADEGWSYPIYVKPHDQNSTEKE
jgi:hypothetical protein